MSERQKGELKKVMNYYNPNFYQNNPYTSGNIQYVQQQQPQMLYNQPQSMQAPTPMTAAGLNGKIVDSADVVRATEVPIGGYGIFPKADLSEIYIKSWNNNGTTSVITFKPVVPPDPVTEQQTVMDVNAILEKISVLENKLDAALNADRVTTKPTKKEITANDY